MIALAIIVVVLPLAPALATALTARARPLGAVAAASGLATLAVAVAIAVGVGGGRRVHALSGFLYLDPLSGFFLATIALVVALASAGSAAYLRAEEQRGELGPLQVRLYFIFFAIFAAMMLASFETGNLGLLWVLIEASTLASCVLVGLEGKPISLEAAWKYIIISSFGVTIALVGTLFLYFAASGLPGSPTEHLTWPYLFAHAHGLSAQSLRLGFLLALIGYGTKVGLAPMHTWLPDAHSEAPSPASAMLSAALLNTGMYAIIRFQALTRAQLGTHYAARILLIFGFASLIVGALFIVLRGNYKRLFAYSSVEHMGIIAIALGFGGVLGFYGALLHTLTHAIGKAVLFLTSGDLVLRYRTRLVDEVRGALSVTPLTGAVLLLGALAVAGSPPFGLFLSEFTIVRAGLQRSSVVLVAALLVLLGIVFVALVGAAAGDGARRLARPADGRAGLLRALGTAAGGHAAGRRPRLAPAARAMDPRRPQPADHELDPRDLMSAKDPQKSFNGDGVALLPGADRIQMEQVETARLASLSHGLATEHDARLADLFAEDGAEGEVVLRSVYALDAESRYVVLECQLEGDHFPPLSDLDPAAFVEECEIYEQYGIRPDNTRRLNRVLVPPHRADRFPRLGQRESRRLSGDYEPHVVTGEAFEFPFGPVRVAGWESLYMGLVTTGEEVLDVYLFHWHKHRGVEHRLRGLDPRRATFFVERVDGLSSVGNTLAFCRAVEMATGTEVPAPATHTRAVALELERIYNHAAAIAAMCQTTGLSVGQARSEIVLERLLRCNLAAFGHRYLFGIVAPGGVRREPDVEQIHELLPAALDEFRYVVDALLVTNSHVDRLESTGIVTPENAHRLSLVGPVARASGQAIDVRHDHPTGVADEPGPSIATRDSGDALARMSVMVDEVEESARLIDAQLGDAGPGVEAVESGAGAGLGWAESPRGEALAWVSLDGDGRILRARLRPASVRNWRAFDDAARAQNVFTDIPIIEASFWLTVAGFAR